MRRVGRSITMIPPQDASRVAFLVLLQTGSPRPAGLGWGGGDGAGRGGGGTSQCWVIQVEPSQEPVARIFFAIAIPCSRVPPPQTAQIALARDRICRPWCRWCQPVGRMGG